VTTSDRLVAEEEQEFFLGWRCQAMHGVTVLPARADRQVGQASAD